MPTRAHIEHRLTVPTGPPVLALGAWFSNTVCALHGHQALISPSVGHLDQPPACLAHEHIAQALLHDLRQAHGTPPAAIAHDLHPNFHSTRTAIALASEWGVPLLPVQHHHAHIAAVCAEHGWAGPVLGLALDGVGLGTDHRAWGGELLRVDGHHCTRLGHLRHLSLPGGDQAAREPWRMAAAVLHASGLEHTIASRFAHQPAAQGVQHLLTQQLHCPPTSSMGRVFDAAAALLGLCDMAHTEALAPQLLEQAATQHGPCPPMAGGWHITPNLQLDLLPLLQSLFHEAQAQRGAARFHATLAAALADWLQQAAQQHALHTVAVGGGCFFNRLVLGALQQQLPARGLHLLTPQRLLPGDTAISFGQAMVARHHLTHAAPCA